MRRKLRAGFGEKPLPLAAGNTHEKSRVRRTFYDNVVIIITATLYYLEACHRENKLVTIIIALRDHRESLVSVHSTCVRLVAYIRDSSAGVWTTLKHRHGVRTRTNANNRVLRADEITPLSNVALKARNIPSCWSRDSLFRGESRRESERQTNTYRALISIRDRRVEVFFTRPTCWEFGRAPAV